MKNHGAWVLQSKRGPDQKPRPITFIFFTLAWLTLTYVLFQANRPRGPGWGQTFLSQVDGRKKNNAPQQASPSPTIYIPDAPKNTGDYKALSFTSLSGFYYWNPIDYVDDSTNASQLKKDKLKSKVPDGVMAYEGQKVAIVGFMIPIDEDEKFRVKTFVLAKSQMTCCYGATPRSNDWLFATVSPGSQKVMDQMDVPLTVYGTLSIDPQLKDPSMPTLYRMTVDKVQGPKKSWF